jgi:hypothetical protein
MELDFLDGGEPADDTTPASSPEGPARGPDGKFTSTVVETAPEPEPAPVEPAQEPEPVAVAPTPEPVQPGHVPITAMLEERDKRKALEEQIRQMRAQVPQQAAPDPYEDPEGFQAYREQIIEQRLFGQALAFSKRLQETIHGRDTVSQAHEWGLARCDADPLFNHRVRTSEDPYEFVVSEWKRDQVLSSLQGDDLDQFRAWKASQGSAQPQAPVVQVATIPPPVAPPRSLASTPAAGSPKPGEQPVGPGVAFDAVFRT